jgi:Domain of unknown function (DUF4432)
MIVPNEANDIASLDQIARVSASRLDGGPADGMRVIDIALLDGMSFRVLPDRGLDIGAAWCATPTGRLIPISWTSKLGEQMPPLDRPVNGDWITRFTGGLLTTCGIDNVGPASEGVGLHGSWSHRRASNVTTTRTRAADGTVSVTVSGGLVDADALGRHIAIWRTITSSTGRPYVEICDTVENLGPHTEPIPILYHCNFGAPFWSTGSTVNFAAGSVASPRDDDAASTLDTTNCPDVTRGGAERVYEQAIPIGEVGPLATIRSPATGLVVDLSWSQDSLPRCIQWIHPGAGVSALGVEPSNASVLGRGFDRANGRLAVLEPGQSRRFRVEVSVRAVDVMGSGVQAR